MSNLPTPAHVLIQNVILSYPNVFTAKAGKDKAGNPQGKPVFNANVILDKEKNKADIERLTAAALHVKKEKWQGKPVNLARKMIRDGMEKEATEGYGPKVVFISARNEKRPQVLDRDARTPIVETDGKIYGGVTANVIVRIWAQDNQFGKALNVSLETVQFVKATPAFGEQRVDGTKVFTPVADDGEGSVDGSASDQI